MLKVLKGFEVDFLRKNEASALIQTTVEEKIDIKEVSEIAQKIIQEFTKNYLLLKEEDKWITYEEFSTCYETLFLLLNTFQVKVEIIENNKYYNIYPLEIYDSKTMEELLQEENEEENKETNKEHSIYSYVYKIKNQYFVQYNNYEYDYKDKLEVKQRYEIEKKDLRKSANVEYIFEISEDLTSYVENILECENYSKIGISVDIETEITKEIKQGLIAYLTSIGKEVYEYLNQIEYQKRSREYKRIAIEEIGIPNFQNFKKIKIYKNPSEGNELEEISQEEIINEIVTQIDLCKNEERKASYRDIFVTAPTGAGKSVMFQIPAVYAANKYHSISIVISPLVELMNDQVENLEKRGYHKSARINSDINASEKEEILRKIEEGSIDILYLSPEALLSYSIESIIGTRDISTIIVDEAHIVTTWGQGFRPDYWYLGSYIERLRRARYNGGKLDENSRKYDFPICTFTATSVFGGKDDGVMEIAKSLYLKDPIRYIGEVKRKDIQFDIHVNEEKLNQTETKIKKAENLKERIQTWVNADEKSLVYFPYNSTAIEAYENRNEFEMLKDVSKGIGIYTGQVRKCIKKESAEKYKKGDLKVMFATKAFGMGIDIKDIKHVYHYAISGNLNDYMQEIGRAARSKDLTGIAHLDYYDLDMNYSNSLFGMSAIKQYHITAMIRILDHIYQKSKRRSNLVTPQAFESVFPKSTDLETSVKTALLNIEKDMMAKYKIPVIITRPRSMFTSTYAVVDKEIEDEFLNGKYGKYFKKIKEGRKDEIEIDRKDQITINSDTGDIYVVDLKRIWEENFSRISFPNFKYYYYENREKIFEKYANNIHPRNKIKIEMVKENETFKGIKQKLLDEIDKVSGVLAKLQSKQGEFTLQQFEKELVEIYKDNITARNIANGYFTCIEDRGNSFQNKEFYVKKTVGEVTKYRITNSTYRSVAESLVYKNTFIKELDRIDSNKTEKYKTSGDAKIKPIIKILNLLSLFNLVQYDMYGGENPEIFIRINDPSRIEAIAKEKIRYENKIVKKATEKHKRDRAIIEKFIKELKTDEERWDYIERYFLGDDVLKEEENEEA